MAEMDDSRMSRAEVLARRLEASITGGDLPAGEWLGTKDDLKQRHGVAAGTLNEALRLLQIRGLVEARPGPGGGLFTALPSAGVRLSHLVLGFRRGGATARDCLEVRNALEPLLVTEATRHRADEDVRALREILTELRQHLDDPSAFLRVNWSLHRRIAAISHNAVLASVYLTVLDFAEEQLEEVRTDGVFGATGIENWRVHEELIEAIASGDLSRAAAATRAHSPLTGWQASV